MITDSKTLENLSLNEYYTRKHISEIQKYVKYKNDKYMKIGFTLQVDNGTDISNTHCL